MEPTRILQVPEFPKAVAELQGYAVAHPNVTVTTAARSKTKVPREARLFWISQNYHDLHDEFMAGDTAAFNKGRLQCAEARWLFYVILDSFRRSGSPANVTDTLHRIESSTCAERSKPRGSSSTPRVRILANPADPRTAKVFDNTIRGHTDQFILEVPQAYVMRLSRRPRNR